MKKAVFIFAVFIFSLVFIMKDRLYDSGDTETEKIGSNHVSGVTIVQSDMYRPLNFRYQKAMWFTSMDYAEIMKDRSEEEFSEEIGKRFENAALAGMNTVYVQVRAFCDAYYPSDIFPAGKYYTDTSYDPLEIMVRTAHSYGLSFHAWINPLRCVNADEIGSVDKKYGFSELYSKGVLSESDGRLWLDPSREETYELVCDGVKELVEKYRVDGIHIDDYFYPTADAEFDRDKFEASGESDLSLWRRKNTSTLVSRIYRAVKSENSEVLFGISPQGSIHQNMDVQFADVEKWTCSEGYCDYIVPQVYYGYENNECPFKETVENWKRNMKTESVSLVIGLCTYKYGTLDKWAGAGADEWTANNDITSRQTSDIINDKDIDGVAFYSYSSTFEDEVSSGVMLSGEIQKIHELLK